INLLDGDLVNLWLADAAGIPALLVGDIDRGGVFAALYGTVALLPDHLRARVQAFAINKFRGDPALLEPGLADLERRTGIPTVGVLPWIEGLHLDAEDSLALREPWGSTDGSERAGEALDVAVVRLPRLSNFTDIDALAFEPAVNIRWVTGPAGLGDPDLVILPGTKATVADLTWLRARRLDTAIAGLAPATTVLGICGGYQMLGRTIDDGIESGAGAVAGLGRLPVDTRFEAGKITRPRRGAARLPGPDGRPLAVDGYQIHHGRSTSGAPWIELDDAWGAQPDGATSADGAVLGTSLHGLFETDGFRAAFLERVAARRGRAFRPSGLSFAAARQAQFDRLADLVEAHLDLAALLRLIATADVPETV
ncbi:MAG TPA: cobyric acid synthase, partial [Acidimicrobiia bacterium]|nr:cobyric acid synthase [Acidimicrobiia bacterium]